MPQRSPVRINITEEVPISIILAALRTQTNAQLFHKPICNTTVHFRKERVHRKKINM